MLAERMKNSRRLHSTAEPDAPQNKVVLPLTLVSTCGRFEDEGQKQRVAQLEAQNAELQRRLAASGAAPSGAAVTANGEPDARLIDRCCPA